MNGPREKIPLVVSAEHVAIVPECIACGARWLPADEERWWLVRLDLSGFTHGHVYKLAWYCRSCAAREFGNR
jgi:hypothetical protein